MVVECDEGKIMSIVIMVFTAIATTFIGVTPFTGA